jgi:hypothetical protein
MKAKGQGRGFCAILVDRGQQVNSLKNKKMKKLYPYFLFVSLFAFSCCKRDNNTVPSIFTKTSYPLAVGNWWQYRVDETEMGGGYDTIMLKVISETDQGTYKNYLSVVSLKGVTRDSGYFLQSDTSLSFTNLLPNPYYSLFPNFHLKFPVVKGQYWQGAFTGDSILVKTVLDTYSAYGHTFKPCYVTEESYNLPHNFKINDLYLTPQIGLISGSMSFNSDTAEINGFAGAQVKQSIQLIDFNVQ